MYALVMSVTGVKSLHRVEGQRREQERVDDVLHGRDDERVAILRRLGDELGPDIAAGTGPIVHDDLLAEPLRKLLRDEARDDVRRAAGRLRHHQPDRLVRIVLGGGERRHAHQEASGERAPCVMHRLLHRRVVVLSPPSRALRDQHRAQGHVLEGRAPGAEHGALPG